MDTHLFQKNCESFAQMKRAYEGVAPLLARLKERDPTAREITTLTDHFAKMNKHLDAVSIQLNTVQDQSCRFMVEGVSALRAQFFFDATLAETLETPEGFGPDSVLNAAAPDIYGASIVEDMQNAAASAART